MFLQILADINRKDNLFPEWDIFFMCLNMSGWLKSDVIGQGRPIYILEKILKVFIILFEIIETTELIIFIQTLNLCQIWFQI